MKLNGTYSSPSPEFEWVSKCALVWSPELVLEPDRSWQVNFLESVLLKTDTYLPHLLLNENKSTSLFMLTFVS